MRLTADSINPVINTISQLIDDPAPPSNTTIRRWYKDYMASGEDVRGIIPATKARGNRNRKVCKDKANCDAVLRIIDGAINEEYLSIQRPNIQSTYNTVVARIAEDNRLRLPDDQLPIPHRNTVYRTVKKIDPYEKTKARYGKRIADLKHRVIKEGARPTRPLERVECDDTKTDLFVFDPVHLMPLGRPWLIILIDVYTKMILGYFLSFVPPSYLSVMQCLLHAIKPKTYVGEKYPNIKNPWGAYGIMETLVVDNAKHWYSLSFEEACLQLGIVVQYAPPRIPWYKPSIERLFKSLNQRLLHQLPGTTFSNRIDRTDYDPQKNAAISLDFLEEILHYWIIDIYQRELHRGINDVPARLWKVGTAQYPPAIPTSQTELEVLIGHIAWRVISGSGVELFGLYYNDECLAAIRGTLKKGEKAKIKFNPSDLSLVYVYDKFNGRYLAVPCTSQDYANGLTLWQHKVIRKLARQRNKGEVDMIELCLAKDYIKEQVRIYCENIRGHRSNIKVARWIHSDIENNRALLTSGASQYSPFNTPNDTGSSSNLPTTTQKAPAATGISNIGRDLNDESMDGNNGPRAKLMEVSTSVSIESKRKAKKRSRRGKKARPQEGPTPSSEEKKFDSLNADKSTGNNYPDDEDLDMTDWDSDYNLPS